jgi:hypothetical protein
MPLQATSGAASYDAYGGGVAAVPQYIEDVFSTWLYTGTGASQTITNNIDLSTKGGLLWIKSRSSATQDHFLVDTVRGASNWLSSDTTNAEDGYSLGVSSFNTTGFTLGVDSGGPITNGSGSTYASWTFRKQPKFFDVVTYTGTGSNTTISHSLGSVPACIMVKRTDTTGAWQVYHRSLANTEYLVLNTTAAKATGATRWNSTTPTSTVFSIGTDATVNASGATYVAYLFAHDAGGFGLTGTDNVISCGTFTSDGSGNATVSLGYEPQWFLAKKSSDTGNWFLTDTMRGFTAPNSSGADTFVFLNPNTSDAEAGGDIFRLNSTGINAVTGVASETYIYIAIRRGPMKVPTSGTSVFIPVATTGVAGDVNVTTNFPVDLLINHRRNNGAGNNWWNDRLRGSDTLLRSNTTGAEVTGIYPSYPILNQTTVTYPNDPSSGYWNYPTYTYANWFFRRAPSFFDVVCYTGTGTSGLAITHNLGVAPEFLMVKERPNIGNWEVIVKNGPSGLVYYEMNKSQLGLATRTNHLCFPTATFVPPTSTQFVVGTDGDVNASGSTYIAYLFATCAGVSKVGSYTGTATTLQIDCGFTSGARFVLIKRSDADGDWYVWDTARGIVSGNDPYLLLNTIATEVTNTDYIDTYSAGFELSSTAPAALNASGGTYIFLAIA